MAVQIIAIMPQRHHRASLLAGVRSVSDRLDPEQVRLILLMHVGLPIGPGQVKPDADALIGPLLPEHLPPGLSGRVRVASTMPGAVGEKFLRVLPNLDASARLAFEHLRRQGLVRFASFVTGEQTWRSEIEVDAAFERCVRADGFELRRFVRGSRTAKSWSLQGQIADLAEFLKEIEKPVGLFACNDEHAWRAAEACRRAGLDVPNDVAIVGHGGWTEVCTMSDPPLTSVEPDWRRVGELAMRRLVEACQAGGTMPGQPILVPPRGITIRASSRRMSSDDPDISVALRYLWDHLDESVSVADLEKATGLTRRTLQRRFNKTLGHGPREAIRRAQISRARELLTDTDQPLAEIAAATGFGYLSQFSRDFKKATGLPPSAYRRDRRR